MEPDYQQYNWHTHVQYLGEKPNDSESKVTWFEYEEFTRDFRYCPSGGEQRWDTCYSFTSRRLRKIQYPEGDSSTYSYVDSSGVDFFRWAVCNPADDRPQITNEFIQMGREPYLTNMVQTRQIWKLGSVEKNTDYCYKVDWGGGSPYYDHRLSYDYRYFTIVQNEGSSGETPPGEYYYITRKDSLVYQMIPAYVPYDSWSFRPLDHSSWVTRLLERYMGSSEPTPHWSMKTTHHYDHHSVGGGYYDGTFLDTLTVVTKEVPYGVPRGGHPYSTRRQFDEYGRLVLKVDPLGVSRGWTYKTIDDPELYYLIDKPCTLTVSPNYETIYQYYDGEQVELPEDYYYMNLYSGSRRKDDGTYVVTGYPEYDPAGNPKKTVDPNGDTTEYDYGAIKHWTCRRESLETGIVLTTNRTFENGDLTQFEDPNGNMTSYVYDRFHRILSITHPGNPEPSLRSSYNDGANSTSAKITAMRAIGDSTVTIYEYDGLGRLAKVKRVGDNSSDSTLYSYNWIGLKASETDPNGHTTYYQYDELGRLIKIFYPGSGTEERFYSTDTLNYQYTDPWGTPVTVQLDFVDVVTIIDANQHKKVYKYDANGNLRAVEEYKGLGEGIYYSTTYYDYNSLEKLIAIVDGKDRVSAYSYDALGRLSDACHIDKGHTEYLYDDNGNSTFVRDENRRNDGIFGWIYYRYDALDRLKEEGLLADTGDSPSFDLDPSFFKSKVEYLYDVYAPDWGDCSNSLGYFTMMTDQTGVSLYCYDERGRVQEKRRNLDGLQSDTFSVQYSYDWQNNLTSMIYPDGHQIRYVYNSLGQVDSVTNGDGSFMYAKFSYYPGDLIHYIYYHDWPPYSVYSYDSRCRVKELDIIGAAIQRYYKYDKVGNRKEVREEEYGSLLAEYSYDEQDRLTYEHYPQPEWEVTYTYDSVGNRTSINGEVHTYYSGTNRLQTASGQWSGQYDDNGNLTVRTNSNTTCQLSYNWRDQLKKIQPETSGPGQWYSTSFLYNGHGYRAKKTIKVRDDAVLVPKVYELAQYEFTGCNVDWVLHVEHDNADVNFGVREIATRQQYRRFYVALHAPNGKGLVDLPEPVTKNVKSDCLIYVNSDTSFGYYDSTGYQHHCPPEMQVTVFADGDSLTSDIILPLEVIGTCVKGTITLIGEGDGGVFQPLTPWGGWQIITTDKYYIYDESGGVLCEMDGSGTVTAKYIYGNGKHIAKVTDDGTYFYHLDPLGSPLAITSQSGNVVKNYEYYAFGETRQSSGSFHNTHKFTGKERDVNTELHYFGARYYDAELGRFITPDPENHPTELRLSDPQSLNPYPYARNNPLAYVDRDGARFYSVATEQRLNRDQLEALTAELISRALAGERPTLSFYHKTHSLDIDFNWVTGIFTVGPVTKRLHRTSRKRTDYVAHPLIMVSAQRAYTDIPIDAGYKEAEKLGVEKGTGLPVIRLTLGGMLVSGKKIVKSRGNLVIITGTQETINEYLNPLGYQVVAVENKYVVETFKSGTK